MPGPEGSTVGLEGSTRRPEGSTLGLDGSILPSAPGLWAVSYEDAVSAAVELLNTRPVSPYVLRLRDTQPWPGWAVDLQHQQELSFTVEETSCRAPLAVTTCQGRWPRAVAWCRGSVFLELRQPTAELSCERVPRTFGRLQTSRLAGFFARIKERFRGFFQCSRIWIRDKLNLKQPQA
ncbi:cathelicidin-B1-like [Falco peregrinus]|uniref:cathelicidin-B1-like n=1 Tax=Falco peregrinus TaxID=8954 RepID=UPI000386F7D0|nr:cathelicidin-B1-like [Falco peregrinus]